MKFLLIMWLSMIGANSLYSQNFISFYTQKDVDDFKKNYGNPQVLSNFIIFLNEFKGYIHNLDSLDNIEYIEHLIIGKMDSLKSVKGFKKLKKVGQMQCVLQPNYENLVIPALDTIVELSVEYYGYPNKLKRLRSNLVNNVKYLNYLRFNGNIAIESFPLFNYDTNFILDFVNLENIDSINLKTRFKHIHILSFNACYNAKTEGIIQLDTINIVTFKSNKDCNFKFAKIVNRINEFKYTSNSTGNTFGEGFKQINTIDNLIFQQNEAIPPFNTIFPNPLLVNKTIRITDNSNLTTLVDYNNIHIQQDFKDDIIIRNNKLLTNCNVDFLCQALEFMPERIVIDNNGSGCTIEDVKKYCTVNTHQSTAPKPVIYPNPADHNIKIYGLDSRAYTYQLLELDGRCIQMGKISEDHLIDIQSLAQGVYLLKMNSIDGVYKDVQKIVKMD